MSSWTNIYGIVRVSPMGRTQAELRYILDTVLDHLPKVTGSEGDMNVYVNQSKYYSVSFARDEFGVELPRYERRDLYDTYVLTVEGQLRDRVVSETHKEFIKWLLRLAKRVQTYDVLVNIYGDLGGKVQIDGDYSEYFEWPSWCCGRKSKQTVSWCEYLMWEKSPNSGRPLLLEYKYGKCKDDTKEVERRRKYLGVEGY